MSDFADLWNSATPNTNKKPANQSLGSQLNASSKNALGTLSQPNSRAHTPSYFSSSGISPQTSGQTQRPNPGLTVTGATAKSPPSANASDAFGDLFALSGVSQSKNLTIAERQAQANQEQAKAQERARKEREAHGAFWDQLEFSTSGRSTPMNSANRSTSSLAAQPQTQAPRINTEILAPSRVSPLPSSKPSVSAVTPASNADIWDLDSFLTSSKPVSPAPAPSSVVSPGSRSAQTQSDLFDLLDSTQPAYRRNTETSRSSPVRSGTPGDFDWGDREDQDDLLGELSRPVSQVRKEQSRPIAQPAPTARREHTPVERHGSPPPHIIGQIVEMGFSVQQARKALAKTSTGIDVQSALESLLATGDRDSGEDRGPTADDLERFRAEDEAAREQYEIESRRQRTRPPRDTVRDTTPATNNEDPARQLQEKADQLLAQASIFGSNMFNRANALWKEGKEKALKVYEERSAVGTSPGSSRDPTRPAWMADEPSPPRDSQARIPERSQFRDDDSDLSPRPQPQQRRPTPGRHTSQPKIVTTPPPRQADKIASLFSDTTTYVSPSRRKPPSQAPTPVQPSPAENRVASPVIQLRRRDNPPVSSDTLSAVQTHRNKGTDAFKLGQYGAAIDSYTTALELLPEGHLTRVLLLNNRAAARSKTGDASGAIEDCTIVLHVIGDDFDPAKEVPVPDIDLNAAFVKALRRRAEMFENTEKWKRAREDWERLVKAGGTWAGGKASSDGVKGVGRCKRMEDGGGAPVSKPRAPAASTKPKPRPRPAPARTVASNPEDSAVHRLKVANAAAEAEGDQKHALKDTIDARILAWKGGKENNIRALIASLDTVLWPELGWTKVGMHELVMPNQVKVKYVRAIAKVHPDKLNTNSTTVEQRMIANAVFGALNEAWNAFEQ